ncbi:hypothetical protein [uncultured Microbacterium sp.]|nr:hypothetical protein [uncultured Microbacterium sp.]
MSGCRDDPYRRSIRRVKTVVLGGVVVFGGDFRRSGRTPHP